MFKLKTILFFIFLLFLLNSKVYAIQQLVSNKFTFSNIIKEVSPAVISVYGSKVVHKNNANLNGSALYNQFFGKDSNFSHSLGSGVIISEDGLVITNAHVVDQHDNITVVLSNGKEYKAQKLSVNTMIDLALLKIITKENETFSYLDVKDEKDSADVGDIVLALGNPFGIGQTVTIGIISGVRYFEKGEEVGFGKLIQIDAAINPGNSGGALINSEGDLIGINSNIYSYNNSATSGIGFAIPASVVRLFIKRYFSGGLLKKYWIGLTGLTVDNSISMQLKLKYPHGVFVDNVIKNAPADLASIKRGDVITRIDDMNINTMSDLAFAIAKIDSPDPINIKIIRNNKDMSVTLVPDIPKEEPKKDLYSVNSGVLKGTVFANNSPHVSYEINSDLSQLGVVVYSLTPTSLLKRLGIEVGDFIVKIGETDVKNTQDLKNYLEKNSNYKSYKIVLKRRSQIINLNINK